MDAGCDNGFTFTAPYWPTDPQGIIYRIKSNYPSHPASSFYYPQFNRLPTIATFQFIKVFRTIPTTINSDTVITCYTAKLKRIIILYAWPIVAAVLSDCFVV